MEAGDIITQPRAIFNFIDNEPSDSDSENENGNENIKILKNIIEKYVASKFQEWFVIKKDELIEEYINYSKLHDHPVPLNYSFIRLTYEEFVENLFIDFYKTKKTRLVFSVETFIEFWLEYSRYEKSISNCEKVEITSTENSWNCIAEWCFDEHLSYEWEDLFGEKMMEQYWVTIDDKRRDCRLSCGVCWENKTLYTGCFQCNGNYICHYCYFNLENEDHCPFCRHDGIITPIECLPIQDDNDFRNWKEKMYFVLNVLNKNK